MNKIEIWEKNIKIKFIKLYAKYKNERFLLVSKDIIVKVLLIQEKELLQMI